MSAIRCGNCHYLDPSSANDIGGLRIARCRHPKGVRIGRTPIRNNYVELNAHCSKHVVRALQRLQPKGCHV